MNLFSPNKNLVSYSGTDGLNFLDFEQVVIIDAGTTKACTYFPIVDDDVFMEGNETFQLDIMLLLPLPITTPTTSVTIIDDDGTLVSVAPLDCSANGVADVVIDCVAEPQTTL